MATCVLILWLQVCSYMFTRFHTQFGPRLFKNAEIEAVEGF